MSGIHDQSEEHPVTSRDVPAARQRKLLYVEDNPANLALVEQFLARRSDLKLLTAVDGHQGIQLARDCQPEIILMDMHLPGISGFDAMQMLREDSATALIPIIALSSNAFQGEVKRCLEAGFFRYLTKPFELKALMEAIDEALLFAVERQQTK